MIYLQLFLSYLKIGFFGFGGGYIMLSLIQHEIVLTRHWLTQEQLADIIAVSQMTPGPIAVNCATYVGYTVTQSPLGSALATLAVCLPPLTIMLLICKGYQKVRNNPYVEGALSVMQVVMVAMVGSAALLLLPPATFIDWKSVLIFAVCFAATWKRVNPILLITAAAIAGLLIF